MQNAAPPEATTASLFHAGNTCPHCQETISAGQLIITCPSCSSVHHENCWSRKPGCSSYHCDTSVNVNRPIQRPDIVLNDTELSNVHVPPPPIRRAPEEVASQYLPKAPERMSRLAVASIVFSGAAILGAAGALLMNPKLVMLGVTLAMGGMISGVIALVFISNAENRLWGFRSAVASVVFSAMLTIGYFIFLGAAMKQGSMQQHVDAQIAETMPTEEQIAGMEPAKAAAMRANVAIQYTGSFGTVTYGSGVVTRLADHKAYILTNKHVIGGAKGGAISVLFHNGERSAATVAWHAEHADLAVIACQALALDKAPVIRIADILCGPGEKVFAIGNPMGLAWSYTEGAISGLRKIPADKKQIDLYQTQTPINSGNSGGGLYTMQGLLIGINTMTEDKSMTEGLNFAIASTGLLQLLDTRQREQFFGSVEQHAEPPPR